LDDKNRPVLAQTFDENGTTERFTVAVNHLKSKGSPCDDVGDPDTGDGQGNCNLTRTDAAEALVNWLATDPTGSGAPNYLIIGDLNSYAMEDPITAIKDAGYTDLLAAFDGPPPYSYVYFGQRGYLDHALANPGMMMRVTGAAAWHINADEPSALDYNNYNQDYLYNPDQYRSSDHDPVVVGFGPSQVTAYENGFEGLVGDEWCYTWVDSTPAGMDDFLGQFGNHQVCLNLTNVPYHNWVTVSLDLYVIRSWNGNASTLALTGAFPFIPDGPEVDVGPDRWLFSAEGNKVFDTTFSNMPGIHQAYPDQYPDGDYPRWTGAVEINSLGYSYQGDPMDAVYHLEFSFFHMSDVLDLLFEAMGLQALDNESWGIDNVVVEVATWHNIFLPMITH
jgi:hypothetical protein